MSSDQIRKLKICLSQYKGEPVTRNLEPWMEEVTEILTELAADED